MANRAAKSYRCSIHSYNFPPRAEFKTCPECGEETRPSFTSPPMTEEEAQSIVNHAKFEEYLLAEGRL